jgi:hypothetical protein
MKMLKFKDFSFSLYINDSMDMEKLRLKMPLGIEK